MWELRSLRWKLKVLWFQQCAEESRTDQLMRILLNNAGVCLILKSGSKLLWLFLKFINGYLTDKHRKVLSRSLLAWSSEVTHRDVCLIGKTEFLVLPYVVDVSYFVGLNRIFATFTVEFALAIWLVTWFDLLDEMIMLVEELISVNSGNDVDWNVWSFMLKASMNVNVSLNEPASMTESLEGVELVPFR